MSVLIVILGYTALHRSVVPRIICWRIASVTCAYSAGTPPCHIAILRRAPLVTCVYSAGTTPYRVAHTPLAPLLRHMCILRRNYPLSHRNTAGRLSTMTDIIRD